MSPIAWDTSLETGDAAVDRQHRAIHDLFNTLEAASDDDARIMLALDFLTEHVLVHFATEEALMDRAAYPSEIAAIHKIEHGLLKDGVRDQVLAFRSGGLDSTQPIVESLREWLSTHVHQCDRQLMDFVRDRGVHAVLSQEWLAAEARVHSASV